MELLKAAIRLTQPWFISDVHTEITDSEKDLVEKLKNQNPHANYNLDSTVKYYRFLNEHEDKILGLYEKIRSTPGHSDNFSSSVAANKSMITESFEKLLEHLPEILDHDLMKNFTENEQKLYHDVFEVLGEKNLPPRAHLYIFNIKNIDQLEKKIDGMISQLKINTTESKNLHQAAATFAHPQLWDVDYAKKIAYTNDEKELLNKLESFMLIDKFGKASLDKFTELIRFAKNHKDEIFGLVKKIEQARPRESSSA